MHLCEAIVLRCRSLAFKRCTGVWRPEADESPFQGDEEGVSPPRGQREARGVNVAAVPFERSENKKSPRLSLDNRGLEERRLPTLPTGGSVPSAMVSLTSLFGMGRGGSSPL